MADQEPAGDTPQDRLAKLLPGDVTAAFLSAKAALVSISGEAAPTYVFWTFIAILILCPPYFRFVTKAKSWIHVTFLTLSFCVFAISIADTQFVAYFKDVFSPKDVEPAIRSIAIVLPILWTYLVTQISVAALNYAEPAPDDQQDHAEPKP